MAKVTLPPGILFDIVGDPPTNIPDGKIKNTSFTAEGDKKKVTITLTFEIEGAELFTDPTDHDEDQLKLKGYFPFKDAIKKMRIKNFIQGQSQKEDADKGDPVAIFAVEFDVDGGKIGGADANFVKKLENTYSRV